MRFNEFAKVFLRIKTKDSKLVPFRFNLFQEKIYSGMKEQQKTGQPMRVISLKPRQAGCTTFGSLYCLYSSLTFNRSNSLISADKEDNSKNLSTIVNTAINNLPDPRPMLEVNTSTGVVFGDGKGGGQQSKIEFSTAGASTLGRSGTYRNAHLSEFAYYENAGRVMTALQSIPKLPSTFILIESTANGISGQGEEFYVRWNEATRGESGYIPVFCGWWEMPDYQMKGMPLEPSSKFGDEKELRALYNVTDDQLRWRRFVIANEMGKTAIDRVIDPVSQFDQEYPHAPDVAFLSSGRPLFDQKKIERDIRRVENLKFTRYRLTRSGVVEDPGGLLKVYHLPDRRKVCLGADVAEGLEIGDSSAIFGVDQEFRQVCSWIGKIEPFDFGRLLIKLGEFYNNALIAPEKNNHGHAVLACLKEEGYQNISKHEVFDEELEKTTDKLGWLTTKKSKIQMLDNFLKLWLEDSIQINDIDLLREMRTISINPDGNVSINGKDRLASACIACMNIGQNTWDTHKATTNSFLEEERPEDLTKLTWLLKNKKKNGNSINDFELMEE